MIMANFGFKEALTGRKDLFEASWPSLDDSNTKHKKRFVKDFNPTTKDNISSCSILKNPKTDFPKLVKSEKTEINRSNEKKRDCENENFKTNKKSGGKLKSKHRRLKTGPTSIPLMCFIKAQVNQKKCIQKKVSYERKILLRGNKLDSSNPTRRKGKVYPLKKKHDSKLRKEILISKGVKKKRVVYSPGILKLKCEIPNLCNEEKLYIESLRSMLDSLQIANDIRTFSSISPTIKNNNNEDATIPEGTHLKDLAKAILHTHNFKSYCSNIVSKDLLKNAETLIMKLRNFQDKLHAKDPMKAFAKRRYVCGFKEATKFLRSDQVQLIIAASNLQLDEDLPSGRVIDEMKSLCCEKDIPLVFAGRGNQIGFWTLKRRRISVVAILNYEGAEEPYKKLLEEWMKCTKAYESALKEIENALQLEPPTEDLTEIAEKEIRERVLSKLSWPVALM